MKKKDNYSNFMSQMNRRLLSLYMMIKKLITLIERQRQFYYYTHFCILVFLCKTVLQVNEWSVNEPKWPLLSQWDFLCTLNGGEMKLFYCKHNPRCEVTTAVRLANPFA